jgi:hypothetical protein
MANFYPKFRILIPKMKDFPKNFEFLPPKVPNFEQFPIFYKLISILRISP